MTDLPAPYLPDEPVIGATPPPPPRPQPPRWPMVAEDEAVDDVETELWEEDELPYDEEEYGRRYRGRSGYGWDDRTPVHQPMFYVFLGLATLVGAAAIFLLVMVFRDETKREAASATAAPTATANAANERAD